MHYSLNLINNSVQFILFLRGNCGLTDVFSDHLIILNQILGNLVLYFYFLEIFEPIKNLSGYSFQFFAFIVKLLHGSERVLKKIHIYFLAFPGLTCCIFVIFLPLEKPLFPTFRGDSLPHFVSRWAHRYRQGREVLQSPMLLIRLFILWM